GGQPGRERPRRAPEGAAVAGMAAPGRVVGPEESAQGGEAVQGRVGQPRPELRLEDVDLPGEAVGVEARLTEQVDESAQPLVGGLRRQVEVDVGDALVGVGVVAATLLADPGGELALGGGAG